MDDVDKQYAHAIFESLEAALSPDKALIDKGQHQLSVLESRPEYSYVLVKFLLDSNYTLAIRQLAGVLFKQYAILHWSQNSEKFVQPEIDNVYKLKIKQLLPHGLADTTSKLRTTVAYSIATLATSDWPELWPELFDILIGFLSGHDLNAIDGTVKTLTEFIDEVTDIQMPQVAPLLMPQIYNIFVNPQHFHIRLRARTIVIFNSLVNTISEMAEYDTVASKKYLNPYLHNFVTAMTKSLSMSDDNQNMDCGLRKEIIAALTTLVKTFPKKMSNYMNDILVQIWNTLVQSSNVYTTMYVNCLKEDQQEILDSEGEELSFENLIHQLFEFILSLKDKKRYKPVIKTAMDELCYYAIVYMQITEEQIENWTGNPEQFVEEEDEESYSCTLRVSGQELLDCIGIEFKNESAASICKAISKHIEHAHSLKESSNPHWWKVYESCLLAINSFKQIIHDLSVENKLEFDLNAFINQVVIGSLYESNYPFLVGRAIYTASKFSKLINLDLIQKLIEASASALESNQNIVIRIFAMKAVYNFCDELPDEIKQQVLNPYLPKITDGLIRLITENATNQIGTITLDTLASVLSVDEKFIETCEAKVVPLTTAMFLKYANDPLINSIVTDIFKIFINNPYTNAKVEQRLLPTIASILNATNPANSSLITSSLDLLTTFVRSSPNVPLSDYLINLFINVANLCLKNDDSALLQSGGECLRAYISKSSDQIISLKNEAGQSTALNYIVMVISHMLDPKTSENSCSFIGKFINTVLRYTSHALGDNLDLILKAVLSKMQASKVLLVQQSLIVVFAHLIHIQMDNVLTFLTNIPGPTGRPVLEFLMIQWVNKQNSFIGPYECKISILALAKLLEHAVSTDDQRFQNVFVKGDRIINPIKGIKTRSKTKNEEELFTQVPLLVKIYKLLINELHSQIEESKNDGDYDDYEEGEEDDDYENCDDEDEDDDEEDGVETDGIVEDTAAATIDIDPEIESSKYLNRHNIYDELFDKDEIVDEDDPDALTDPLMNIDLLEYLTQYIRTLSQHPCYTIFKQHHNDIEKDVLKEIGIAI